MIVDIFQYYCIICQFFSLIYKTFPISVTLEAVGQTLKC